MKKSSPSPANSAGLELLGKYLRFFEKKVLDKSKDVCYYNQAVAE